MANDKNFKVKNALEIGGSVKSSLGTVTSSNIDLSTGNYFKDTTNTTTYTISNPSPVQSFNLELTGATADVGNNFSTTLYSGANAAKTITNNIDLAGDGGLVWTKWRSGALGSAPHVFTDTERGVNKNLKSNTTDVEESTNSIDSFTSTGYTIDAGDGPQGGTNYNGGSYVSWTFKKAAKFFDVVTYTGNGSARNISHNLGSTPGMIITKAYSSGASYPQWYIHHRSLGFGQNLEFTTSAAGSSSIFTASNSTTFSIGSSERVNENGKSFVAYIFGHDTTSTSMIQCGSYTGNGADVGNAVNLGWQPQWLLVKNADVGTERWHVLDSVRGINNSSGDPNIHADNNTQEFNNPMFDVSSTGFTPRTNDNKSNGSGHNYIYVAIRSASDPAITWPATVKWPGGITPTAPGIGETDLYTFTTDDSGSSYYGYLSGDNLS